MTLSNKDLKDQLKRQLGYIHRSATMYDADEKDEAIRIGTALRVMFHQTVDSKSLLHQLNATSVLIRSGAPDRDKQNAGFAPGARIVGEVSWSLAQIEPTPEGGKMMPLLNAADPPRFLPVQSWWEETVAVVYEDFYCRSNFVLWAVNKDGGAHVDKKIPAKYARLKEAGAFGNFKISDCNIEEIEDAHYIVLRSMAFEVLNSPDLAALIH